MDVTPEVMPCELVKMCKGEFITKIPNPYCDRMKPIWTEYHVDMIETDYKRLLHAYNFEVEIKDRIS